MLQNIKCKSAIKLASWQQPLSSRCENCKNPPNKSCTNRSQKSRVCFITCSTCVCCIQFGIRGKKARLDYASGHKGWKSHAKFHQRQGPAQLFDTFPSSRAAWAHTSRQFSAFGFFSRCVLSSRRSLGLLPFIESGLVPEQILCAHVKGRKSFTCVSRWKLRFHVELAARWDGWRLCAHIKPQRAWKSSNNSHSARFVFNSNCDDCKLDWERDEARLWKYLEDTAYMCVICSWHRGWFWKFKFKWN